MAAGKRREEHTTEWAAALLTAAGMLLLLFALRSGLRRSRVFPEAVTGYRPLVEQYAAKEGILSSTDELLAIMTVESGGELKDLMQSSESMGLAPDTLDSEESIAQGCRYYASILRRAAKLKLDRKSAFQAYNYGPGYLSFVAENGGVHTRELAERFAKAQSGGETKKYSNPLAVEANGGWRYAYGNMFYAELADNVLQERRKEMEPGNVSKLLVLLTAAGCFLLAFMEMVKPEKAHTFGAVLLTAADLKRKGVEKLVKLQGFRDGIAGLLLLYGLYLYSCPAEFCGAVLLYLTGTGIFGGVTDHPALFLKRGMLPLAAFLSILAGTAF